MRRDDLLDDVTARERAPLSGQPRLNPGKQAGFAEPLRGCVATKHSVEVEAAGSRALSPLAALLRGPHAVLLSLPGFERGDLGGSPRASAPLRHPGLDLAPPARELAEGRVGDAGDLRGATVDLAPGDAELSRQLGAEVGLVEVAGGLGAAVQALAVERSPLAIRGL